MKRIILITSVLITLTTTAFAQGNALEEKITCNPPQFLYEPPEYIQLDASSGILRSDRFVLPKILRGQIRGTLNTILPPYENNSKPYYDPYYPVIPGRVFPDENMIKPLPLPKDPEKENAPLRNFPNWRIEKLKNIGATL